MYKLDNLSHQVVSSKYQNYLTSVGNTDSLVNLVELEYSFDFDFKILEIQAETFANEIFPRGGFYWPGITMTSSPRSQLSRLKDIYIYSFAKSLFYGYNTNDIRILPHNSPVFVGHGILHRWISRQYFSYPIGDMTVMLKLSNSKEEFENYFTQLKLIFPFLSDLQGIDGTGAPTFSDPSFDRILENLLDAANFMTDKKSIIRSNTNNLLNNQTPVSIEVENQADQVETSELTSVGDSRYDPKKGNTMNTNVPIGHRVVEIFSLSDPVLDGFVSIECNPLGNSALSKTSKNKWYYLSAYVHALKDSLSYHVSRANFVSISIPPKYGSFGFYYDVLPRNYSADFLIASDVRSITYLKTAGVRLSSPSYDKYVAGLPNGGPGPK